MAASKRLVIIDGKSVFYRGYYAMPNLSKPDGTPTGGVYGFMMMALDVLKKFDPDYACVAWDKSKTNTRSRRDIYPEYKANRKPAPDDFKIQIPILHDVLEALGWPLYEIDDYEADDIMGAFAKQAEKKDYETILVTGDHDVLQMVSDKTKVAIMKKGITNIDLYDPQKFTAKYEMDVNQFIDYKALRGDPSDNIPGVAGVGEKTATQLIKDYSSLDGVYENIEKVKGAVKIKLEKDKDMAYLSKQLVTIMTDVPLKLDWKAADVTNVKPNELHEVLSDLEFKTLIKQLPAALKSESSSAGGASTSSNIPSGKVIEVKNSGELDGLMLKNKEVMILPRYKEKHGYGLESVIISDSDSESFVVRTSESISQQQIIKKITNLLKNKKLIGFELKTLLQSILHDELQLPEVGHDLKIASFVLNPLQRDMSLGGVVRASLGLDLGELTGEEATNLAGAINNTLWALYDQQKKELKDNPDLSSYLDKVEFPFITPLAKMEHYGVKLDQKHFSGLQTELEDDISDLEQTIYGLAGREFNIGSPAQLSVILFDELELPTAGIKKGKTAYSTAASELKKLQGTHEIIDHISSYREAAKLKNTYVDVLPGMTDDNDRLHSSFSQTTASTGRLSSSDPNVQNIPIRSELGQKVRKGMVADEGNVLIQADYSQFELRLAAALSGDKNLIEIFNNDTDIHTQTAVRVLGVNESEITKDQRAKAKAVNFGILYGQGPHGLSEGSGMTMVEAKEFIQKYYEAYPELKEYLDGLAVQAKEGGFVSTLLGRKRPTPDAKSGNFMVRQAAVRAAVNMPIQGTAADLTKLSMIELDKKLPEGSRQVLQIHDSIIVEVSEGESKEVGELMKSTMEKVYKVPVNLKVDVNIGTDWGQL